MIIDVGGAKNNEVKICVHWDWWNRRQKTLKAVRNGGIH